MVSKNVPVFESALARRAWVLAELKIRGKSFASIAREHGCSAVVVQYALSTPNDRQEKAIAAAIGVTQEALFPERYDSEGRRLHKVKGNAPPHVGNVKNNKAA